MYIIQCITCIRYAKCVCNTDRTLHTNTECINNNTSLVTELVDSS